MTQVKPEHSDEDGPSDTADTQPRLESEKSLKTQKPLIAIGVDIGTTYSGAAFNYIKYAGAGCKAKDVLSVQDWHASPATHDKVPTKFAYVSEGEGRPVKRVKVENGTLDVEEQMSFKWGYDLEVQDRSIEYIKLLLRKEHPLPGHIRREDVEEELARHDKTVETAAADYLRALRSHIDGSLTSRYGASRVKGTDRLYVLTVPAIWSDAAKNTTRKVAIQVGFPEDLLLVSEPEAAAIWTIRGTPYLEPKVGDTYIVCDAGGGTVDLISYEITQLHPLKVKEAVAGSGGLCGGSFINEKFEQSVREKVGITVFDTFKQKNPEIWHEAMLNFEIGAKRTFDPVRLPGRIYNIRCHGLPDNHEARVENSNIRMTTDELKDIFEPIVVEVTNLIEAQVEAVRAQKGTPAGIFLVGGFANSKHLFGRLQTNFGVQGIEVLEPPSPWSAVARGAVIWASENGNLIQSRKSRVHYGIGCNVPFDPDQHPLELKHWDTLKEEYVVRGRFKTFIELGQTVHVGCPTVEEFERRFPKNSKRIAQTWLYTSENPEKPKDVKESQVSRLCCLQTDLNRVPKHHFRRQVNSKGVIFHKIEYLLKMQLESGGLRFWLEVDGFEYSAVTAEFV